VTLADLLPGAFIMEYVGEVRHTHTHTHTLMEYVGEVIEIPALTI
jgi:hypothetical protein